MQHVVFYVLRQAMMNILYTLFIHIWLNAEYEYDLSHFSLEKDVELHLPCTDDPDDKELLCQYTNAKILTEAHNQCINKCCSVIV